MTQTVDQVLLEWLDATPRVPRRERQALLLKELLALHAMHGIDPEPLRAEDVVQPAGTRDLEHAACTARVTAALRHTVLDVLDTTTACRVCEAIALSTSPDVLCGAIDAQCVMTLHVAGDGPRRPAQRVDGVDAIVDELCEFHESVLLLRVDPSSSARGARESALPPMAVGGVSAVKCWVQQCAPELEVGTQVTYYADAECTQALFDVRSCNRFAADGARIERITREVLPRGGHDLSDVLSCVHVGHFKAE